MGVRRTKNLSGEAQRDLKNILAAVYQKFEADNPAWAAALPQELKDAIARILAV